MFTSIKRARSGAGFVALLGALVAGGAHGGCGDDGKPKLSDKAHVASNDEAKLASIHDDRLEFPSTSDFASSLNEGDIVVSGYEGGFLRKVKAVKPSGDKIVIPTEDASLEDIVESGTLGSVTVPAAEEQSLRPDYRPQGIQDMSFSQDLSNKEIFKKDGLKATITSGQVNVQASLDLGMTYDHGLQAAHAIAFGQITVDLEVEVEASVTDAEDTTVELWHSDDIPIPIAEFVACRGQFVIQSRLQLNASGRATMRVKETIQLDAQYGLRYTKEGGFEKVEGFSAQHSPAEPTFGAMVDVDGKVALQGGMKVSFYPGHKIIGKFTGTEANISVVAGPYARLKLSNSDPPPGWGLTGGVAVTAKANASALGHGFGPWEWDVYESEEKLLPKADEAAPIDAGSCSDNKTDGTESDMDCGGSCADCGDGSECVDDSDCTTGACAGGVCAPATCQNGAMDAGETGVDCGGSCLACPGDACADSAECAAGNCSEGACEESLSCYNDQLDAGEEEVDCGGPCAACPGGQVGSCDNGALDAGEEDVDCGGPCPSCGGGGAGGAGGFGGAGGAGGFGGAGGAGGGPATCDQEADCNTCLSCADSGNCSQAYSDCTALPECTCYMFDCGGDQTCADQTCGDYSGAVGAINALASCESCECPTTCGASCP